MYPSKKPCMLALIVLLTLILAGCTLPGFGGPPPCSTEYLIQSIDDANANGAGLDVIDLEAGCIYQLPDVNNTVEGYNGTPTITSEIIINGNGATVRRDVGSGKSAIRLFHISQGGILTINNLRLMDGMGMDPVDVLDPIRNNGGAIYNNGTLTVDSCVFDLNKAKLKGGAIFNAGLMTVTNTTFFENMVNVGNEAGESGGAIYNTGTATLSGSILNTNVASQSGAGIANSGTMTVINSTLTGNATTMAGIASGAAVMNSGNITISYTTITQNFSTTAGAVFSAPDTIEIQNSIIADNFGGDCSYPASSTILGSNINSDGSCIGMVTDDPLLEPLAHNGGPTMTHAIPAGSPARDAALGLCPALDQRGVARPQGVACDLGAYEYEGLVAIADTSLISGIVYNDINTDGVIDPDEDPFAGVELVLASGTCAAPGTSQTVLSEADGSYQFEVSPPTVGDYCLSINPLTPPNDTILIPGNFTVPALGQIEITLSEGEDLEDQDFGWDFQFSPGYGEPNLVITEVVLSDTTIPLNGWVEVDVTIENQGFGLASGFELVLIPHYGWGPPNPAGYEIIPDLAPGESHTFSFSPGVLYANIGTFTLRVLVTDDWYSAADPDSTGSAGDLSDHLITVEGVNLVITDVAFSDTTVAIGEWITMEVTVENQGNLPASGYDVVIIPHYGWGPPNPAGLEALPVLDPGDSHTVDILPGLIYSTAGAYTVRTLVTDDWYEEGDPESTGSAGDYQDDDILVLAPTPTPTPTAITGKIGGKVFHDTAPSGWSKGDSGLAKITVSLVSGSCGRTSTIISSIIVKTTTTLFNGDFLFENIPPGYWCVGIALPDYPSSYPNPTIPNPPQLTVNLGPGDELLNHYFGFAPPIVK